MTFGKQLQAEDLFKRVDQVEHRRGLKVVVAGPPGSGKSHFLGTCPPPVRVIDTQFGMWPVARKFVTFLKNYEKYKVGDKAVVPSNLVDELLAQEIVVRKDIGIFECQHIDPRTDLQDSTTSLANIDKAINALKDFKTGTIGIDSITDVYPVWCQAWLEATATAAERSKKTGAMLQLAWGRATERVRGWLVRLMAKPCHFVATAQVKDARGGHGEDLGYMVPHWHNQMPYWTDVVLMFQTVQEKGRIVQTFATIEKCRWERVPNTKQIEDLNWDGLIKLLRDDYGVKVHDT